MASLDRTFTFKQVDHISMLISQDLEFDMVRRFNVLFNINGIIPKAFIASDLAVRK